MPGRPEDNGIGWPTGSSSRAPALANGRALLQLGLSEETVGKFHRSATLGCNLRTATAVLWAYGCQTSIRTRTYE